MNKNLKRFGYATFSLITIYGSVLTVSSLKQDGIDLIAQEQDSTVKDNTSDETSTAIINQETDDVNVDEATITVDDQQLDDDNGDTTELTTITLNEFLSKFTCDGCGKRCSIAAPKCHIGDDKQEAYIEQYNVEYGV